MTMDGWQARTEEVADFIAVDGFDAQLRQVVDFQITFGNQNPEQQERVWDSIKSMIRGLDGSPVRRGKKMEPLKVFLRLQPLLRLKRVTMKKSN